MTLEKVLRGAALVGIFCLPFLVLVVAKSMFFPFITGKNFTFRILVELIGSLWLALALVNPQYRPRRSWALLAFTTFVVVIGIADVFGVNPAKSIWSNYERMEGWVTLAHLFVYFAAAVSLLSDSLWKRWWQLSLGVSVLVGFFGLFQLAGLATINQGGVRLDATLGNATYLAVYMLFHVFIAALFLAHEWNTRKKGHRTGPVLLYGSIIILDAFILYFTATRGAVLGLVGGALLAAVLYMFLSQDSRVKWYIGAAVASVLLLGGGLWLLRDTAFVQSNTTLERLTSISPFDHGSQARFMNWNMAWQGVKERPLLGWGQENYAVVFDKYYDAGMHRQESWFDRVHQLLLDWLIAGGVVGLAAYLSLYAALMWMLWRSSEFVLYERSIITGLVAGYFFYLFFTFDNIISYILFVSLFAFVVARASSKGEMLFPQSNLSPHMLPALAVGALFVAGGSVWFVNADALSANRTLIQALSPQSAGLSQNLENFKTALAYDSFGDQEVREHLSQTASQLASGNTSVPAELRQAFFELASKEMALQMQDSPLNARFPFFLGILHDTFGDYGNARIALAKAHELSPQKQAILLEMGLNALARGEKAEALRYFDVAYNLETENTEARIYYMLAAIEANDTATMNRLTPELIEKGGAVDKRLISSYASQGRFEKIVELARGHVAIRPQDAEARLTLGAALYESGDPAGAVASLEETKRALPAAAAQAAAMIEQMLKGARQ